ncbi:unnamed protein product [Protopolystoma xenopodis]|uniref:Uncharacterized protein n=1 Tax=Protopolystoma xenopodis TaxID=117903 RepID=A0A3S5CQ92_9PLAT|nr:unnamed protein product [Protopolystoma xenopodis]
MMYELQMVIHVWAWISSHFGSDLPAIIPNSWDGCDCPRSCDRHASKVVFVPSGVLHLRRTSFLDLQIFLTRFIRIIIITNRMAKYY